MGADALAGHRQGGGLAFLSPWHEFRASIASPPSTQILYATSFQKYMLRSSKMSGAARFLPFADYKPAFVGLYCWPLSLRS